MSIFTLLNLRIRIALLVLFSLLIVKQPCATIDIAFVSKESAVNGDAFVVRYFQATDYREVGEIF